MTEQRDKIRELEGMTDCINWRCVIKNRVKYYAEHASECKPKLVSIYNCTQRCALYSPSAKAEGGVD